MIAREKPGGLITTSLFDVGHIIEGRELSLVLEDVYPTFEKKNGVPAYIFGVVQNLERVRVGQISLRLGQSEYLRRIIGHIGYQVHPAYRGRNYALKACRLLRRVALRHGFTSLFITCNPDNIPSRKTIEKLGAHFVSEEKVPRSSELYRRGDRYKLCYEWMLVPVGDGGAP